MTGRTPFLLSGSPLEPFVAGRAVHGIDTLPVDATGHRDGAGVAAVLVDYKLQHLSDYRSALQGWFDRIEVGGVLIVVVPHAFLYERRLALPSPWRSGQKRLYTPASLLMEVEEALEPNSYRVRYLGDLDHGYDYAMPSDREPTVGSDLALVLERIAAPGWELGQMERPVELAPPKLENLAFQPERTRIEIDARPTIRRLLVLKLDHLGDFVMALPALERLRHRFANARIDLVVGSWNAAMARDLAIADRVIAFDAFPRNSSEEEADVHATLGQFRALVTDEYDLAIDMRTDTDTRILLDAVRAPIKAGIGTRSQFPFLDIALPLDRTRNQAARARDDRIWHHAFQIQGSGRRRHFALHSDKDSVERDCAIIWGPYLSLEPGDYIFDFYLDLDERRGDGLLHLDVAIDNGRRVAEMIVSGPANFHLPFRIDKPKTVFEARVMTVAGHPSISFDFFGGRLVKQGPGNLLHQSEYQLLLLELVMLRIHALGLMRDLAA